MAAEKAAHEARRSTNWSIVATFLSAVSLFAVAVALKLTVDSNRISREAQRAWVSIAIIPKLIFRPHKDGLEFHIDFVAENIGETIATHFDFLQETLFQEQAGNVISLSNKIENQIALWKAQYTMAAHSSLLPHDKELEAYRVWKKESEIPWWAGMSKPDSCQPVFLAAVFYRTTSHPELVQLSWRTWYLSDYDINDRPTTFISKGPALTTEHIHIEPFRLNLVHEQYAAKKG